jgi:amino acid adenylation domain-containing protein
MAGPDELSEMGVTQYHFQHPICEQDISLAWSILVKDYAGTLDISFYFTNCNRSMKNCQVTRLVHLDMSEEQTLGNLRQQLAHQMENKPNPQENMQTTFRTQLQVLNIGTCASCREAQVHSVEDFEHYGVEIDWRLLCFISEDGTSLRITTSQKDNASPRQKESLLLQQLETVLSQVHQKQNIEENIHRIHTASKSDIHQIWKWNASIAYPTERTAVEIFSNQFKRRSHALAVHAWDGDMSYRDLDSLSTMLARRLAQMGVGKGIFVPLCFEKSMWTPVACLAVMKTGAAFVILDEALPQDRLKQLSNIISLETIVALSSPSQQHRAKIVAPNVFVVDSKLTASLGLENGAQTFNPIIKPSDIIYIVFTSGTTGVPKAALIQHSNICSFVSSVGNLSDIKAESRVLALASYAYDVSLGNIFLALLSGSCLCIPSSWECKNDVSMVVSNYQITHAQMTPSVSKMIDPMESHSLQVLDLCGEPCSEDALARWRNGKTRIMNTYSPAECTVTSVVNENVLNSHKPTIIGKGLGACWIVDPVDHGRLSARGGVGELILEGPLVGAGYLHNEKATRAAFIKDPEWLIGGYNSTFPGRQGRLYRTGDLVRYTEDGQIEYIGRRDFQVKIRGQRIELGEVSAHLQSLMPSSIQWCLEVAKMRNGAEILVVFLVLNTDGLESASDVLRATIQVVDSELRRRLPSAMVPGAYACIESIPLSLTGKTDHAKLKRMALSLRTEQLIVPNSHNELHRRGRSVEAGSLECSSSEHSPSSTARVSGTTSPSSIAQTTTGTGSPDSSGRKLETLKLLWGELFGIGVEEFRDSDSFFGRGGESLMAIKLVSAAARRGLQLDVATVFRHPQLSDLASHCKISPASFNNPPGRFSLLSSSNIAQTLAKCCETTLENIEDAYPCTPLQQGLITTAMQQEQRKYVGRQVIELPEYVDTQRLARAWQKVAAKHPILRTRIVEIESEGLLQVVLKNDYLGHTIDANDLSTYLENENEKEMGLGTSLCRWCIIKQRGKEHLVLTMHHAIYDGWTLPRLGAEVFRAYRGERLLPSVGFNVFLDHISSLSAAQGDEFWATRLAGPGESSSFPIVPHILGGSRADSTISKIFNTPLNAHENVSMPSLLRSAWALLMARMTGGDDVVFGATVSGRNVAIDGIEDLLAPTISTIPVRVRLDMNSSVQSFVGSVQNEAIEAMPFEHMGLQNIRKINSDTRQRSDFQTLLIIQPPRIIYSDQDSSVGPSEQNLKDLLESLDLTSSLSDFNEYALMILIEQERDTIVFKASYDSRVISSIKAEALLEQFIHVTAQLGKLENLSLSIQNLEIISDNDIESIWGWNCEVSPSIQDSVHNIILQNVALQPQAEAIRAWDGSITFQELDKLSSAIAHTLQRKGVRKGRIVPICMPKSKWMAIAMLGILRTGAAFVAMDTRHQPKSRLQTIVQEADPKAIVVTAGCAIGLALELSKNVVICDRLDYDEIGTGDIISLSPSDAAFLVFTSGSTGIPKGIVITHENFCTTIHHHERELCLSKISRIYDYASYSFDIAVHNALMAMSLGACLCVPSQEDLENNIEQSFERLGANWMDITPSVARIIEPSAVPNLKTLVLSGEAITKDIIQKWVGKVSIINAYGPAECQICTVQSDLKDLDDAAKIGRGVACATWIVDPKGDILLPIGAIGELVIEGPIVSPGYLNTNTPAFINGPTWLGRGSTTVKGRSGTLYRTGDLARYLPDGTILYAGRANTQTKINGQRLELGEIEFYIRSILPLLRDVVVETTKIDGSDTICAFLQFSETGTRELPAFYESEDDPAVSATLIKPPPGLQAKLKDVIPCAMVPTFFFQTPEMPLTATRKADRRKLREFASSFSRDQIVSIAPQDIEASVLTETEQAVAELWSTILRLDLSKIQPLSDFFRLGGDSIAAMRLVKSGRERGLSLRVIDIFRNPQLRTLCRDSITKMTKEIEGLTQKDMQRVVETIPPFDLVRTPDLDSLIESVAESCNVQPHHILDMYPCTAFQEGVLAHTSSNSSAYIQHTELKLNPSLSLNRVLASWDSVIASNPILRTRIIMAENGNLMQVVIRESQEWRRFKSTAEYFTEATSIPMGLGTQLSRFALVRTNSDSSHQYKIIWSMHHAIYDSWTINLILKQVSEAYHGKSSIRSGPNYNVFVDFVGKSESQSIEWWKSAVAGASDAKVFPKLGSIEKLATVDTGRIREEITLPRIKPPKCTTAILIRSAWAILMARHTGSSKILFGETRFGRDVPIKNIESINGPTITTVPVILDVIRDQTLTSFLADVRERALNSKPYEHLGLSRISHIGDDGKAACGFQTLLVVQRGDEDTEDDSVFQIDDSIDDIRNFSSYYLTIVFNCSGDSMVAEAVFNESVMPFGLVSCLLQQFQSIIEGICNASDLATISQLDQARERDLNKIWSWNATVPTTRNEMVHNLVSGQARKNPNALAIDAHDGSISYRDLDAYSTNLSIMLRSRGVGVGCVVPLCFEKSRWAPVAMMAVLKTGAAFSIMDVAYPDSRLQIISKSVNARFILCSRSQVALASTLAEDVIMVDDTTAKAVHNIIPSDIGRTLPDDSSESVMYVCFTSGSTGVPKGVVITHRNIASAALPQTDEFEFGPGSRVYDFSSHAFDAHIWHTWWALISGACLCIPSNEDRLGNLAGSMNSFQCTMAFLTPSVARTIDPRDVPTLKKLFLGGEGVTAADVQLWTKHVELWGGYGPTEATPVSLFSRLKCPEQASNIGKAIGLVPWICNPNDHNELSAIGATGELVLEGPLVGLGYNKDPAKTSNSFIVNPSFLVRKRFGRVYKTGDLVRYTFDGSIEYLGRADSQVKLRGQRVEFGEIEFHLRKALPTAHSIVCDVISHEPTHQLLLAFCVMPSSDLKFDIEHIRNHLGKILPPYMIPETFLVVNKIPTNNSGKVDRQKLKAMGIKLIQDQTKRITTDDLTSVRRVPTQYECFLRSLWVICVDCAAEDLHVDSDFFKIGGDSIAAMKLSSIARKHNVSLTVQSILAAPRLSDMAAAMINTSVKYHSPAPFCMIDSDKRYSVSAKAAAICGISVENIEDIYPCSPLQTELFALTMKQSQAYIRRTIYEIPTHLDFDRAVMAWNAVISLHDVLRTRFVEIDGFGLLNVVEKGHTWDESTDLGTYLQSGKMDLGSRLSQMAAIYDEGCPKIVWTAHHAIYDGWSAQIIHDQIVKAYNNSIIPPQPKFNGFIQHLISQDDNAAIDFWKLYLEGSETATKVYPELPSMTYQSRPTRTFERLLQCQIAPGASVQATIHAAWALIVSRMSENDDIVFAATLAGRDAPIQGIEQMVGPTIAPVPIRVQVGNRARSIQQLISSIENNTTQMIPYQHYGTRNIERINKDTSTACKFQTLIVVTPCDESGTTEDQNELWAKAYDFEPRNNDNTPFHTFSLVLFFVPNRDSIALEIVFDPEILNLPQIERLSSRLESVFNALNDRERLLSDINCLCKEDYKDIRSWNSDIPTGCDRPLQSLILKDITDHPHKVAIDAWDQTFTYEQLDHYSTRICAKLHADYKIGPGAIIPILSPKSGLVPIATIGILKSGAAFLPLDPSQPLQRLKAVVDQVKPPVVLTTRVETSSLAADLGVHLIFIEEFCTRTNSVQAMISSRCSPPAPDDIACVLFTSGSTGVPKGVMQTHRALSSAVALQAAGTGFDKNTRAFEFASYAFDVSWNMMFKTLATGGTLCVPSEYQRQNDLAGTIDRFGATLIELTASVARLLNPAQVPLIKTLIFSGEPVNPKEFTHWEPHTRLVVCYGPSECTSVSTINRVSQDSTNHNAGIGKGSGCLTWVVDPQDHCTLVPVGAVGEILIEGPIVGKGYYKNETLTNLSYVNDLPILPDIRGSSSDFRDENKPRRRGFKSGDLAYYDLDGNLHFVARKDAQAKLRGQRIELEEIQYHVRQSLAIEVLTQVVACILHGHTEAGSENDTLAVFMACSSHSDNFSGGELIDPPPDIVELLRGLDNKLGVVLPKYMIPSAYYFVADIPKTRNGKIDRKKLVKIAELARIDQIYCGRSESVTLRRAVSTQVEFRMQRLWATALNVPTDSINANDNFFTLGGDSISAMRLVANARREGVNINVADIFKHDSLSSLAHKIHIFHEDGHAPTISEILPFSLLGDQVDIQAVCNEAAATCGLSDSRMIGDVYPCTPLQESMMAASIKEPGAFTSMRLYRIGDEVDIDRLKTAWTVVARRNSILRTRLVDLKNYGLNQVVVEDDAMFTTYSSMTSFLEIYGELTPISQGSRLMQFALIEEADERKLVWVIHHAIYDGWMLPIIEQEVKESYLHQLNETVNLDMRTLVKYLIQENKNASVEFWGEQFQEKEDAPSIFPQLPSHSYEPKPNSFLELKLRTHGKFSPAGATLSEFLYGSWSILLSRLTGNSRISFGAILTGRNAPVDGIDRIIGPTITTVPILADVNNDLTINEFMTNIRDRTVRMIPHEHLGVHAIRHINEASATACSFQTVLVIQPRGGADKAATQPSITLIEELDETKVEGFPNQHNILNQYCLMMEIIPDTTEDYITIRASYDSTVLTGVQMKRTITQWEHLMKELCQRTTTSLLSDIDIVCPKDIDRIWNWNHLPTNMGSRFVHEAFSKLSIVQPTSLAIDAWDGSLTYQELDFISSDLAERLVLEGVGPGCFVPLLFPKSIWANVSMLAVLKAGGAFVPLDAEHPEGRLRAIMQPLGTNIILCSAETRDRAARLAPHALLVDSSLRTIGQGSMLSSLESHSKVNTVGNSVRRNLHISDIAYAVFTSGSTGSAKGVKISHANLATAIAYQAGDQGYRLDSRSRSLDSSSYAFDACVCNFFYTILTGGCLCVPSDESLKGDIGSFMRDYKVNWAQLVPSVARTLETASFPELKTLVLTGEPITRGDIDTWCHKVRLVNAYGPTECTILCAISPDITGSHQIGNIGKGRGANLWLTEIGNPNRLAPVGAVGEILIEGPIVGLGYLGPYDYPLVKDPEWLTFGTKKYPGRRGLLYRTGDQARYDSDGNLVFVGRIGSEIKLRGQRVDLAGIEDVIRRQIPQDIEIVADILQFNWDPNGHAQQMMLIFASNNLPGGSVDKLTEDLQQLIPTLKKSLNETLPIHLHPEAFIGLDRIPKTSSGKTDRRRLRAFGSKVLPQQLIRITGASAKTSFAPPTNDEERLLAKMWAKVLNIEYEKISREDDFFQLGGDSLGVMRLTTVARENGRYLKTRDVFSNPKFTTLAQKMQLFKQHYNPERGPSYLPYSLVAGTLDVPEFVQRVVAPTLEIEAEQIQDIIPANGFQVDYMNNGEEPLGLQYAYLDIGPDVSWTRLVEACRTVVQSFQCLRARFILHQNKYYQILVRDAPLLTEELQSNEQVTTFSNRYCPTDCRGAKVSDILTKITLVDFLNGRRRVILRMSHMQNDGWCTIRILKALENVFNHNLIKPTPDWTSLLHHREQTAARSRQYWRQVLAGADNVTSSVIFKPAVATRDKGLNLRTLRTHALPYFHTAADNRRTRPTVILNVAWALVLQRLAGHEDVVFGNVTTGRNGAFQNLDAVIGPCVNMLPMRLQLGKEEILSSTDRGKFLRRLVEASAKQVDGRMNHEGLDWDSVVNQCTTWPEGSRYNSAVHFRNMTFEPEIELRVDSNTVDRLVVAWYELVATPHWTTVLAYPEGDVLRLWLLADPAQISEDGADEILNMLDEFIGEITGALDEECVE